VRTTIRNVVIRHKPTPSTLPFWSWEAVLCFGGRMGWLQVTLRPLLAAKKGSHREIPARRIEGTGCTDTRNCSKCSVSSLFIYLLRTNIKQRYGYRQIENDKISYKKKQWRPPSKKKKRGKNLTHVEN
jgi:hypothetical protein